MNGLTLYELLYASLDLPEQMKQEQLQKLLQNNQMSADELTLENLREMVADLLHTMILETDNANCDSQ